jgi:two-component system sensor kinase FixL
MKPFHVFYLAGLCVGAVLLVTAFWEFALEDLIPPSMSLLHGSESTEERLEYVITSTAAAALVAGIFSIIAFRAVSKSDQSVRALHESEQRFRDYTESASEWYWEMGPDLRFTSVSEQYETSTGYPAASVIGKRRDELGNVDPCTEHWARHLSHLEARRPFRDFEYVQKLQDGSLAYYSVSGTPLFDANGNFQGYRGTGSNVTKRKHVEQALQKTLEDLERRVEQGTADYRKANKDLKVEIMERKREEERFRRFFSLPLVGSAIYGSDKRWIEVNDKLCDLFGYSGEELRDLTWVDVTHPDDLAENLRLFEEAYSGARDLYTMDKRFIRKNGDILHCSISVECVRHPNGSPNYFMLLVQDLTERRRAEDALRESLNQLRTAQKIAKLGHWSWDAKQDALSVSLANPGIPGLNPEQMQGLSDAEYSRRFVHPADQERVLQAYHSVSAKNPDFDIEYRLIRPDGQERIVHEIGHSVCDETGEIVSQFGTLQDVTEKRAAEIALRERGARLRDLELELMRVSRINEMGLLSSALAHELNQPLTAIMNYVGTTTRLVETGDPAALGKAREMLEKSLHQAGQAAEIIRSLRALFEKGQPKFGSEEINQIIEESCQIAFTSARKQGIDVQLDLGVSLPPVAVDKIQIQQVLINLVRNSIEAMSESERGVLSIRTSYDGSGTIKITVCDTGKGLPKDVQERLFQPFVTTKPDGMGVGLSISRSAVEVHGGRLWAEPNQGGGTIFSFTLPVSPVAESSGTTDQDQAA